jgi:hypothetical protein
MADGTASHYPLNEVDFEWNGEPRTIRIVCLELNPLLGTELLSGWQIHIDLTEGGEVLLAPPN